MANFIKPRGDYRTLLSYQKAEIVYDITFRFCGRFLSRFDPTNDQMIQAARSGKQNIAEGSKAASTSRETELRLTNVARASFEELLLDYEDYLRVRDLKQWDKDSKESLYVRELSRGATSHDANADAATFETFREFVETRSDEVVANIAICLIHQANYLLDKQIAGIEQDFLKEGGLRERMSQIRREVRSRQNSNNSHDSHNSHGNNGNDRDNKN
jgi:four helix bundle suffix protein